MIKPVNETVAIGSVNTVEALQQLSQEGYQTLIDLCPVAEGTKLDQSTVEEEGLNYIHLPISIKNLDQPTLDSFHQALITSPQKTYIRCASGLRAAVFTLLSLAKTENWSLEKYLEEFEALAIAQKSDCPLGKFAQTCLSQSN